MNRWFRRGVTALLALVLVSSSASAQTLKAVAMEAEDAPLSGYIYRKLTRPVVSDASDVRVAFFAVAKPRPGILGTSQRGLFGEDPVVPANDGVVALKGDPSPAGPLFVRLQSPPSINADREIAWASTLKGRKGGVFRGDGTSTSLVSLFGDDPGLSGGLLETFSMAQITDDGDVVFRATINMGPEAGGATVSEGVFACTGGDGNCSSGTGALTHLVLQHDPVSDRAGRAFCSFEHLAASNFGIALAATTKEGCSDEEEIPARGVFRMAFGGSIETIALEGEKSEPFPDPTGTFYGSLTRVPAISNNGIVAFHASMGGILAGDALYVCDPAANCPGTSGPAVVAQRGDVTAEGDALRTISGPGVSDAGDVAFKARASKPAAVGIYRVSGGEVEAVARKHDPAPKLDPLEPFGEFRSFRGNLTMSPGGRIVFMAKVKRVIGPKRNRRGIFVLDLE
jgi:hypothetical protein